MPLPQLKGVAGTVKERAAARSAYETLEDVEKFLAARGFVVPVAPPPYPQPEVSADQLTTDFNRDYTTLFAQQLGWVNYTGPILARVKAALIQLENAISDIETRIRIDLRAKNKLLSREERLSEQDIADTIQQDPDHKILSIERQKFDQQRLLLDSFLDRMERNMKVISRQIELRKLEMGGEVHENNMPARGGRFPVPRR